MFCFVTMFQTVLYNIIHVPAFETKYSIIFQVHFYLHFLQSNTHKTTLLRLVCVVIKKIYAVFQKQRLILSTWHHVEPNVEDYHVSCICYWDESSDYETMQATLATPHPALNDQQVKVTAFAEKTFLHNPISHMAGVQQPSCFTWQPYVYLPLWHHQMRPPTAIKHKTSPSHDFRNFFNKELQKMFYNIHFLFCIQRLMYHI